MMPGPVPPIVPLQVWPDPGLEAPFWRADAALARSLFTTWAIRTGRALRLVPVAELTAEELIEFWADDQLELLPERSCSQPPSQPPSRAKGKQP
jgi:hypothetical protein